MELMTPAELLSAYKATGDDQYKWSLVLRYEDLVRNVALQIRGIYSSFAQVDDIISEGILTLLSAVDKFDPDKGIRFETYVSKRIRGMVIDLARKNDWMPRNIRKRSKEIDSATAELYHTLGRAPSDQEVAEQMNLSLEKYQKLSANVAMGSILSLDALIEMRDSERGRFDIRSKDLRSQPESAYQEREIQQTLAEAISRLRKNEQIVLSLYYEKNLHMKEIAQILEVSEARVSQIRSHALSELRTYMDAYIDGKPLPNPQKRKRG
ncbi:MAG: FliA/WhiG family RNA polymerase sigma factor [Oscillospiraceae bacterium]|nr:FliA/WhiG family RNA polymerase sigma factor [Oscillospiraceae bacterium]